MKIVGPERYNLSFDAKTFMVTCSRGTPRFSGSATTRLPKLYVVSIEAKPIYVGVTRQPMRSRFRLGFNATGEGGYHGYAWRHKFKQAVLDIWCHEDPLAENPERELETVEAEVVFLVRCAGQWPEGQTEIHFHPSTEEHRKVAANIWRAVTSASLESGINEAK
jgi:hypothetical protein